MRNPIVLSLLLCGVCNGVSGEQTPLGPPGTVAAYELADASLERPAYETENRLTVVSATIRLGPAVVLDANTDAAVDAGTPLVMQWYNLKFTRLNGDSYQFWILIDGWPSQTHSPAVAKYLWQEPGWSDPLNFIHEVNRQAVLPRLDLWTYGWPQSIAAGSDKPTAPAAHADTRTDSGRAPATGTPDQIMLHGWLFKRVATAEGQSVAPPAAYSDLPLNPGLLNGWLAFDRDQSGRPLHRLGKTPAGQPKEYEYTAKTAEELTHFRDAGANFLVTHPGKRAKANFPGWLTRSPMYHNNLAYQPLDWPADLYRSNYWGFGNHIDEPGVHNWGLMPDLSTDSPLPEVQVVQSLQGLVRQGVKSRGQAAIRDGFSKNFGLGSLRLREGPESIVSWEYEWPTAWYQLAVEDGVGGIVDEDVSNNDLIEAYNMGFETSIPPTVENAVAIRVAVLRGAARNFNKTWGVAFYRPDEVKLKSATIPLLYDKGASYFWYWTGWIGITDNSGLPYPYQLYYTTLVRQAFLRNPDRDQVQLLNSARVAVVIPYGYTFTPYAMHGIDWLHLERENQNGVKYRKVLANAAHEVERWLREGIDFDIVVDDPKLNRDGYEELVYAQADGRIRIERIGQPVEYRDAPRTIHRPTLGPGPRLSIEVMDRDMTDPDQVRLRAVGKLGTGDWAGERPDALVSWEIYSPDNRVRPTVFPEYGAVLTLRLERGSQMTPDSPANPGPVPSQVVEWVPSDRLVSGKYLVRAAMADVFGRPAVAYRTLYIQGP